MSPPESRKPLKVGILGCTGTVGQRFITLLKSHPYFVVHTIGASERSAGKKYNDAVNWKMNVDCPDNVKQMIVEKCEPAVGNWKECDLVFSGLDSSVAGVVESAFLKANIPVFSNAKNHRTSPTVPLVVPLVNPSHLSIIPHQRSTNSTSRGFIVTNSNCSTTGLVVVLKALTQKFGAIDKCLVQTMQAISGAGYPGIPSLDIFDNVVPFIDGEEDKIHTEPLKILGELDNSVNATCIKNTSMKISASVNRVPVLDGHTLAISLSFASKTKPSMNEVRKCLEEYVPEWDVLSCPSAPEKAIHVFDENAKDRPQPRLDRERGKGMTVSVGRVRDCNVLDVKMVVLSHNTVLGAAGSSILNAEIAVAKGYL
ncbi:hypothetical protein BKA69DRAFT_1028611 [Paraphysoderma sedebokerense]|nr:hypothetical protein BKA69DRAFT_1028611 [Paraphysoderma sedebokerense]